MRAFIFHASAWSLILFTYFEFVPPPRGASSLGGALYLSARAPLCVRLSWRTMRGRDKIQPASLRPSADGGKARESITHITRAFSWHFVARPRRRRRRRRPTSVARRRTTNYFSASPSVWRRLRVPSVSSFMFLREPPNDFSLGQPSARSRARARPAPERRLSCWLHK